MNTTDTVSPKDNFLKDGNPVFQTTSDSLVLVLYPKDNFLKDGNPMFQATADSPMIL